MIPRGTCIQFARMMALTTMLMVASDRVLISAADDPDLARDLTRVRAYEHARVRLIEECRPATACMFDKGSRAGGGSGVVIDNKGYGLTNFHVIAGMMKDRVGEAGFDDGNLYEFDVLGVDPTGDVAMFRVKDRDPQRYVELGSSSSLTVGDFTLAMGNPFLLAEDYVPTVTFGIISGLHRYQAGAGEGGRALRYTDCIQVDTSINPGNSGGPLFDMSGRLIGINGRISLEERGRVNIGVGYAISIDQIRRFIPAWRAGLTLKHASAGFTVRDREGGVVVDQIIEDGPAYNAGLRLGDRVDVFAGRSIRSANQFGSYLGVFPENWPVRATILRKGASRDISFRLEDMPLPKMDGGADPSAPHPVTRRANEQAIDRLIRLHRNFCGDEALLARSTGLEMVGARHYADTSKARDDIDVREDRRDSIAPPPTPTAVELERAVRWMLISGPTDAWRGALSVVSSDEVDGRICAVVRGTPEGQPEFSLWFDDMDGRLLRLSFLDRQTRREVTYDYSEFRKEDGFRFPMVRTISFDGAEYAIERMTRIKVLG